MSLLSFETHPLWLNLLVFAVAAGAVWFAGVRLERYADAISRHTGQSHVLIGMLILAPATSLPEIATSSSAAWMGNRELVVHNLAGAVVIQLFVLALADWFARHRGALTFFSPHFSLLFQGVGLITLLMLAIAGMAVGLALPERVLVFWPTLIFVVYLLVIYLIYRLEGSPRWLPMDIPRILEQEDELDHTPSPAPFTLVIIRFTAAAALVLIGGWTLSHTADAIAVQSGLGAGFIGVTLLALATSLPEISTTLSASRSGRYSLAISNIFGSNAFNITLLFVAQFFYRDGAILANAQPTAIFSVVLGSIFTCIYLWGLLERENRTVLRLGLDSAAVVVLYAAGLVVLYYIR